MLKKDVNSFNKKIKKSEFIKFFTRFIDFYFSSLFSLTHRK